MKLYSVTVSDLLGREFKLAIDAKNEKDVKDVIYKRYGMRLSVLSVAK